MPQLASVWNSLVTYKHYLTTFSSRLSTVSTPRFPSITKSPPEPKVVGEVSTWHNWRMRLLQKFVDGVFGEHKRLSRGRSDGPKDHATTLRSVPEIDPASSDAPHRKETGEKLLALVQLNRMLDYYENAASVIVEDNPEEARELIREREMASVVVFANSGEGAPSLPVLQTYLDRLQNPPEPERYENVLQLGLLGPRR